MNIVNYFIIVSVFFILYTYLFFPVAIMVAARFIRVYQQKVANLTDNNTHTVAILCAMYNEEDVAEEKIANFKSLTYPGLRMYIGSDGSSDCTNEILANYADDKALSIFTFPRRGKVHVINDLMTSATEDIFVFTDANSMFTSDAIEKLIIHLSDPQIGAVCGRLQLIERDSKSGEGFYWRFETMLKKAESVFRCVVGGNGAIYAVRRELVQPLPVDTINDDFTISMRAIQQGFGITYAETAVATEEVGKDDSVEFKRHVRDAAGHYRAMRHLFPLLNPFHPKRFFFYVSHRVIMCFVPHLMLLLLALPFLSPGSVISSLVLSAEGAFYLLAAAGWATRSKQKLVYIPYYFSYINLALLVGFLKNLLGVQKVTWDRTQRV